MTIEQNVDEFFHSVEEILPDKYLQTLDELHAEVRNRLGELNLDNSSGNNVAGCTSIYIERVLEQELEIGEREAFECILRAINSLYLKQKYR